MDGHYLNGDDVGTRGCGFRNRGSEVFGRELGLVVIQIDDCEVDNGRAEEFRNGGSLTSDDLGFKQRLWRLRDLLVRGLVMESLGMVVVSRATIWGLIRGCGG